MTRKSLPAYVSRFGKKGLLYFRRHGRTQRMYSEPGTAEFAAEYALLLKGRPPAPTRTVRGLVQRYKESTDWARLAPNTKRSYVRHLDWLMDAAGHVDPATIRRATVYEMQDALKDRPTDANRKIGVLSALLTYGAKIEWLTDNPARGIDKLPATGRTRHPWPQDKIEAFRDAADPRTRLIFELLLGTGQRIGDVLAMQWGHIEGDGIRVRQEKTAASIYVPFTSAVRAAIAGAPRRGLHIITQANGRPVSYNLAWRDIMAVRQRIGAGAWDIHALRHSAASEIASLPGMTSDHVRAITGHSSAAMIRLYAGGAMQRTRAQEAVDALENRQATKRESVNARANHKTGPQKTLDKSGDEDGSGN